MTIDPARLNEELWRPAGSRPRLESWYTQGFSDGLGDRLLMFDNTDAPSWELLRLRKEFSAAPGFEDP